LDNLITLSGFLIFFHTSCLIHYSKVRIVGFILGIDVLSISLLSCLLLNGLLCLKERSIARNITEFARDEEACGLGTFHRLLEHALHVEQLLVVPPMRRGHGLLGVEILRIGQ